MHCPLRFSFFCLDKYQLGNSDFEARKVNQIMYNYGWKCLDPELIIVSSINYATNGLVFPMHSYMLSFALQLYPVNKLTLSLAFSSIRVEFVLVVFNNGKFWSAFALKGWITSQIFIYCRLVAFLFLCIFM